ncbi:MAG: iron-sulfur cluster assembly protein [Firmicutes bacterium]|nr:iron-sulfur cluster assembly protein [Bacillota bacterium]
MDTTAHNLIDDVWNALKEVTDPELDEPLTALGFVREVRCRQNSVQVTLALPTYWCAPNFAYLMMEDLREAIRRLPWVRDIQITLRDHESADALNQAIDRDVSFQHAFADATDDLAPLRRAFAEKAFYARQKRWLDAIQAATHTSAKDWTPGRVKDVEEWALAHPSVAPLWRRYQASAVRQGVDLLSPDAPVVVDGQGRPIMPDVWERHWRYLSLITLNMDANAHLCRGLFGARYDPGRPRPSIPGPLAPKQATD